MGDRARTLTLRPPTALQRLWYRRLGLAPPLLTGHTGPAHLDYARLVPYEGHTGPHSSRKSSWSA